MGGGGIPHVLVGGGCVEISAHDQRLIRGAGLSQPAMKPLEPEELALIERRPDHPTIGGVQAHEPNTATDCADHAGFIEWVEVVLSLGVARSQPAVAHRSVTKVGHYV